LSQAGPPQAPDGLGHRSSPGNGDRSRAPDLSVILPAFNEEDSVRPLYEAIVAAVEPMGRSFEIIFVDDGSRDRTFERCQALAGADPRVRVIKFRRNFGQTPAMVAGIDHARGAVLITMDADLQNDPADIPLLVRSIDEGCDLVAGWRHNRQDKMISRKLPSVIANRLIAKVTGVDIKDNGCSLKAYRAELIKRVPLYAEMHRFIPAMSSIAGARIAQVQVRHHARRFGQSKYGLSRVYKVLLDLLVIKTLLLFARRPLFCFTGTAFVAGLVSMATLAEAVSYAMHPTAPPTIVFMSVAMLLGSLAIFLVLLGVIGYLIHQASIDGQDALAIPAPVLLGAAKKGHTRGLLHHD
jgi:Glycosyl transferase family 2